jgi:hypothetical protein
VLFVAAMTLTAGVILAIVTLQASEAGVQEFRYRRAPPAFPDPMLCREPQKPVKKFSTGPFWCFSNVALFRTSA